jgi:hypothetical protein
MIFTQLFILGYNQDYDHGYNFLTKKKISLAPRKGNYQP